MCSDDMPTLKRHLVKRNQQYGDLISAPIHLVPVLLFNFTTEVSCGFDRIWPYIAFEIYEYILIRSPTIKATLNRRSRNTISNIILLTIKDRLGSTALLTE